MSTLLAAARARLTAGHNISCPHPYRGSAGLACTCGHDALARAVAEEETIMSNAPICAHLRIVFAPIDRGQDGCEESWKCDCCGEVFGNLRLMSEAAVGLRASSAKVVPNANLLRDLEAFERPAPEPTAPREPVASDAAKLVSDAAVDLMVLALSEVESLLDGGASDAPWVAASVPNLTSREDMLKGLSETWITGPNSVDNEFFHVMADEGPERVAVCLTGNGPKRKVNAKAIVAMRNAMPMIFAGVQALLRRPAAPAADGRCESGLPHCVNKR